MQREAKKAKRAKKLMSGHTFEKPALVFAALAAADFSPGVSTPGSSAGITPVA
jgi:hypothetical protein